MTSKRALLTSLRQKVYQLYSAYSQRGGKKIYAKFDRSLFSENFATFPSYLTEIEQTLQQIEQLADHQTEQLAYFANKLIAQCRALQEALSSKPAYRPTMPKIRTENNDKMRVHQLPPAERLSKYYEALNKLNDKLDWLEGLRQDSEGEQQTQYQALISQTLQRKQRCCEAIALLEEYLTYAHS